MFSFTNFYNDLLEDLSFKKVIRIVMLVGGYTLLRRLALNEIKRRQVNNQIADDNKQKAEERERQNEELIEKPETATGAQTFGWGNKTRRNRDKAQAVLEKQWERMAEMQANADDSDEEIAELLED